MLRVRTGSTPEEKEKPPDKVEKNTEKLGDKKLEEETKKLEKRLLLRKFITKALEIKRAEIVEATKTNGSRKSPSDLANTSSQGLIRDSKPKLTFYDVVKLACQQALAEKTRKASVVDLIDFSDAAQPVQDQAPSTRGENDLDLSGTSDPRALQFIDPFVRSQNESRTAELLQNVELTSNQPASPEPDSIRSQPTSGHLLELVDTQASHVGDLLNEKAIDKALSQPTSGLSLLELADSQASYVGNLLDKTAIDTTLSQPTSGHLLELVDTQASHVGDLLNGKAIDNALSQRTSGLNLLELIDPQTSHAADLLDDKAIDTTLSQPTSGLNLLDLVDSQTSHAGNLLDDEAIDAILSEPPLSLNLLDSDEPQAPHVEHLLDGRAVEPVVPVTTSNQQSVPLDQSSATAPDEERDIREDPAGLRHDAPEASQAGDLGARKTNEPTAAPASLDRLSSPIIRSIAATTGQEIDTDEIPTEISPTSTAAPSIFSHFSSLTEATGATGSSLLGITEEDLQARNSPSQATLRNALSTPLSSPVIAQKKALDSVEPSIPKSPAQVNDAPLNRSSSTSSTPAILVDKELTSKPQQTECQDNVSLPPQLSPVSNIDEPDKDGFPWIVQAARDGNEEIIQKLLVSGADIKASHTTTLRHALSEAAMQDHPKIVDLLIKEGCPLEHCDAEGYTALQYACQKGHLSVAKSLITNGASIDAPGPQGQTALHLAMHVPHQNVVMLLIQHKANVNARDATSRTPLHIGASQGNVAMCSYLLNEGAQLDSREVQSKTSLQLACEAGHYDLVQMMLNQANLNPIEMTFLSAFFAAVEFGHIRIAESFFSRGLKLQELQKDCYKPATLAAKSGSLAMVELMINQNCDANARDEKGWNALHFASYHGHYQIIERLIANNVSTIATTSKKETPLLFAVKGSHFPVAERLLRCSKDDNIVSAEDEQGQQAVHHTARTGSIEIFNLLMSNGAKINVENSFGWQPLHIATAYGHLTLVQRLLEQGANVDEKLGSSSIKNNQTHKIVEDGYWAEARWPYPGSRPLHLACEYGHYEIAKYIISKGAKREATCSQGWQPLHHAAYVGSSALVEMLLVSGVYPHATTKEGRTAQELGFCTGGEPIEEVEKERITKLLKEATDKVRKQKTKIFKGALKKTDGALKRSDTVEEKNNLVRAVTFSMNNKSRPHTPRVMSSSDAPLHHLHSVSSSHRPPPHHAHTSPLPLARSPSLSESLSPSTPQLPESQAETQSPVSPPATDSNIQTTEKAASEEPTANSTTDQLSPLRKTNTQNSTLAPDTEMQVAVQAEPKMKRKSTFGLSKRKPGMDIGKLSLGSLGNKTFEIGMQGIELGARGLEKGKQTLELGKQGIELGKQGIELGMQTIELGKQGLEAVQGMDVGRQGFDIGMQSYRAAKKFAKKGRINSGKLGTAGKEAESSVNEIESSVKEIGSSVKEMGASVKEIGSSGKRPRKSRLFGGSVLGDGNNGVDLGIDDAIGNAIDNKLNIGPDNNNNNGDNDGSDDDDDMDDLLDDAASGKFSLGGYEDLGTDLF